MSEPNPAKQPVPPTASTEGLPEYEPLTPEMVEDEAIRGDFVMKWAVILLAIAGVWMAEFINTALEAVVDLASPDLHPLAKVGKDVAAAAVLVGSLTAVLVGLLILGPPLWGKVSVLFGLTGL